MDHGSGESKIIQGALNSTCFSRTQVYSDVSRVHIASILNVHRIGGHKARWPISTTRNRREDIARPGQEGKLEQEVSDRLNQD